MEALSHSFIGILEEEITENYTETVNKEINAELKKIETYSKVEGKHK